MRRTFNKPRKRCNSNDANSIFEQAAGELHAKLLCGRGLAAAPVGGDRAWPDIEPTRRAKLACGDLAGRPPPTGTPSSPAQREGRRPRAHQAPLVWRVPEGPEGTGGLRGAAPNEVRMPSLAGGRDLRRPEHPWGRNTTGTNNVTRPRPVSRPRPRHSVSADQKDGTARIGTALIKATAPPAIRRSCPRGLRPRRGRPLGGRRGRGTGSRTRSPGPRHGRSGSTAGRHRARHTRRA